MDAERRPTMAETEENARAESAVHHGGPWPIVAGFGAAVACAGLVTSPAVLGLGVVVFAAGVAGWIRNDLRRASKAFFDLRPSREALAQVSSRKLAMWLFLATEIMFFTTVIGGSWALRSKRTCPLSLPLREPLRGQR
jgi:hypothetical protein